MSSICALLPLKRLPLMARVSAPPVALSSWVALGDSLAPAMTATAMAPRVASLGAAKMIFIDVSS